MSLLPFLIDRIRSHGPITFAEFMELALYHPDGGYYAGAAKRSGGAGDFYTSVDLGPMFGELLAAKFAELVRLPPLRAGLKPCSASDAAQAFGAVSTQDAAQDFSPVHGFDLVEAAAGNGRLARDVLDGLEHAAPEVYAAARLRLVERSEAAHAVQAETLGRHASKLLSSSDALPDRIDGILYANELLDALPTHAVVMREEALREVFVDAEGDHLIERELPVSTPEIPAYLDRLGIHLEPGWRAEVNLEAVAWVRRAARALRSGFIVLIDYGHEAKQLYSASHASGTLATFSRHVVEMREPGAAPWLREPGSTDITAHVDFTSVREAAASEGLATVAIADQLHALMGLDLEAHVRETGRANEDLARRLALKTLLLPGGLGTTHHFLIFGRAL